MEWRRNTKQETGVPAESSRSPPTSLYVGFVMTEMVGGIFKEDIRYRPHLLSVVGAGTDQPFYVAMHMSKWDVFTYMHGGSHTYCRAAGTGAGQCVSTKTSPALKVLGNERARFPPKCKRRVGLQSLGALGPNMPNTKTHKQ